MLKTKILIILLFVIGYLSMVNCQWSVVSCAMAQRLTLSISPPLIELLIKPGKSVLIAYTVQNQGDPTILLSKVLPFKPTGIGGKMEIIEKFEGPIRFNLENADLTLEEPFFIKSKDSRQLLLKIRVPEGAPEGDYYYSLLVQSKPPKGAPGGAVSGAAGSLASNILISVSESGATDIKGKIAIFDVLPRYKLNLFGRSLNIFESSDKIPIVLVVTNSGKNMIKPQGEITLTGNFGEKASYEIIPQNILNQSQRLLSATPSASLHETRPSTLTISGFFVGNYKLSASLDFGEGTPKTFSSTSFFAFPIKLMLAGFVAMIIGVMLIKKTREKN